MIIRQEISRRRKERCKKRGKEIHEAEEEMEDRKQKRRKLDEGGRFKTVIQKQEPTEKEKEEEYRGERKKRRIEINKKEYKVLGGEWKDMEIEPPIDWQKRRREILARLEEEEKTRLEKREGEKTH